jgi:hypothetical protein
VAILVGVNGTDASTHAARHADVSLVRPCSVAPGRMDIASMCAGNRGDSTADRPHPPSQLRSAHFPQLHALIQDVQLTSDREEAAARAAARSGVAVSAVLETPYLVMVTVNEMVDHLLECRNHWGISYFSVRDIETFAPVMARLRNLDSKRPLLK